MDWLLKMRDNAEVTEFALPGLKSRSGLTEFENLRLDEGLKKTLRIMPYDNWAEGFYIAKIAKGGEACEGSRLKRAEVSSGKA